MTDEVVQGLAVLADLVFGQEGTSGPNLLEGWADPEAGFTWSTGAGSRLELPMPSAPFAGELWLEIALNPFTVAGRLPSQHLSVWVGEALVGEDRLEGEGTVAYRVPARAMGADGWLMISLRHAQAARPADLGAGGDTRRLGFMVRRLRVLEAPAPPPVAVSVLPPLALEASEAARVVAIERAVGLTPEALAMCFEGLGHNCEFGILQRRVGAEPLGLLRFAGITLDGLLHGLECRFEGLGTAISVHAEPADGGGLEYIVRDETYDIGLHSFLLTDQTTIARVQAEFGLRLRFMRDHFIGQLQGGDRMFVFQRPGQITRSQAAPLLTRLRAYGPNALLYVDQSPGLPPGAVEQLEHGLFHGTLDRMAPARDLGQLNLPAWLSLCANAWRLWGLRHAS